MRANMGIMITASHNPHNDNGLKLFGPDGMKLSDKIEKKTYQIEDFLLPSVIEKYKNIGKEYES